MELFGRIREAQKHTDPTDPDPQHGLTDRPQVQFRNPDFIYRKTVTHKQNKNDKMMLMNYDESELVLQQQESNTDFWFGFFK